MFSFMPAESLFIAARYNGMKLKELADRLGAELSGSGDLEILDVAGIREAGQGQITYITGKNHLKDLEGSRASAAIVPSDTPDLHLPLLRVKNPRLAFARLIELFHVAPYHPLGISDKAAIGRNVIIGTDPSIHPYAVIADDARIGDRVTIYPGVYVGRGSVVGADSINYPNVSIREGVQIGKRVIVHSGAVIGGDGFGFVTDGGKHHKIPQVGGVVIEDDVEIGSNSTIDRATLGETLIRKGTKIDNLVQVAHNVTIGEHCLLAGQVGIAGSCTIGDYVILAGRVGLADHITIGDRVIAAGGSAIIKDIPPEQVIGGFYSMPMKDWLKVQAVLPKLPELKRQVSALEKEIQKLKDKISGT
jgi:UDP-3-O-[3-hydroxymyristoyl] glucosamine N-acyltransferase